MPQVVDLQVSRTKVLHRPTVEIPDLRRPEYEHLFHDPKLAGLAKIARDHAVEMAYAQYTEQAILAGMFGNCVGMVRTTIAAGATAQTSIATGSLANGGASGNMDQTPVTTTWVYTGHPGAGATINQYTAQQAFKLTGSAATTLTIASQTVATAVTAGDAIFVPGWSTAGGGATNNIISLAMNQQLYIGLSTQAFSGATGANVLTGEPAAANGYARIGAGTSTPATLWNNQANFPLPTAATPSVLTSGATNAPWSFPASTGSWASGSNLQTMFFADASTNGGGNVLAIGQLGTAEAVAASGITLSFASGAITLTLT